MLHCLYVLDVAVIKFLYILSSYSMAQGWNPNSTGITRGLVKTAESGLKHYRET